MLFILVCFILCPMPKHRLHSYKTITRFIGHGIFPPLMSNFSKDSTIYKRENHYGIWLLNNIVYLQYLGMPGGGNTLK